MAEGNPINAGTGNKYQAETDFIGGPATGLTLTRHYNSNADASATAFGIKWRSNWQSELRATPDGSSITAIRPDGRKDIFNKAGTGAYVADADVTWRLAAVLNDSQAQIGWRLTTDKDDVEYYDMSGKLISITTRAGLITRLDYDSGNRLTQVTGPFGHTLTFQYPYATRPVVGGVVTPGGSSLFYYYDESDRLYAMKHEDLSTVYYLYEKAELPTHLTGIIDELGNRYASWGYDMMGRAVSSQHAGGTDLTTLAYNTNGTTTVTDARGNAHSYNFMMQFNATKPQAISGAPVQSSGGKAFTYDTNGFLASRTDFDGNLTTYVHDARGNETSRTEGSGTPLARTITTTWHASFHLPTKIVEPNRTTTFSYDATGNLLSKTITAGAATRTFSYTYNAFGQVLTATDPRGNVTTYAYDAQGNLASVTNALGHVTSFTDYDGAGRLLRMVDPNGLITKLTYDKRGRITSHKEGALTTRYAYDAVGNLTRVTLPDASFLVFTYDAAHRLIKIADALGNFIGYALDAASNRVKERVYDPAHVLKRDRAYAYDSVNRLIQITSSLNRKTTISYDDEGNPTSVADPLRHATSYSYDALNRLAQSLDPKGGPTTFGYDANDHLTSVTDPRGLKTGYAWNGLDNQRITASPDTAKTARTFDAAGNVLTSTDARGKMTTFAYDALNRRTRATFADGTSVAYEYDQGSNGIGRLTKIIDPTGSTSYAYDANGHVVKKTEVVGALTLITRYAYDAGGRLASLTYPSGRKVTYAYDAAGRVVSLTTGAQALVSGVAYQPFGGAAGWTFGNGAAYARSFDRDGRITGLSLPANDNIALTYDAAGRITKITDSAVATKTFIYDALDRLTRYAGGTQTQAYGYDADGNRISASLKDGAATKSFAYAFAASNNRLAGISGAWGESFGYDPAGNMLAHKIPSAHYAFAYNARGRLGKSTLGALSRKYGVNGLGQRVLKVDPANASGKTIFVYDEEGHLIGEYDTAGAVVQETAWLGDLPVATIRPSGVFYIAPDHLGAPHQITDAAGQVVWLWDHDPFGNGAPTAAAGFAYNLRFPGQYYDAETGLFYNYFRDYDPKLGRYVQSDPIGLAGGINTYGYAEGNPVSRLDPLGLDITIYNYREGVGHVGIGVNDEPSMGFYPAGKHSFSQLIATNGAIKFDPSYERFAAFTIKTTHEQDVIVKNALVDRYNNPGYFSLGFRQCTGFVRETLKKAGLASSDAIIPSEFFDNLVDLYKTSPRSVVYTPPFQALPFSEVDWNYGYR